jgi:hypothetical protein
MIPSDTLTWRELRDRTERASREVARRGPRPDDHLLSDNGKTSASFDLPIFYTCRPTRICPRYCYGLRKSKLLACPWVLPKQLRTLRVVETCEPEQVADRLYRECVDRGLSFLRWNGIGDLTPKTVAIINCFVERYTDVASWVVTRNEKLAPMLMREAPTLFVQFSLDSTPESRRRKDVMDRVAHDRVYYSFMRAAPDDDTMGAAVTYNLQQGEGVLPTADLPTLCPADTGASDREGACLLCRKCFSPVVLDHSP